MACGGIQFMSSMPTLSAGASGGVGICGSQASLDTFVQGVNQNFQLIANCYAQQFGVPLTLPGIPQVTVQVPGFDLPSMPSTQGEVLGRVPPLGRSHIGNVLPLSLDGGEARSKYKYPASAGVRVPDWVTTVAGVDPLDIVFQAIFNNYAVVVTALAQQGIDVPMPSIPLYAGACGGDGTGGGEPGSGDANALVVQQQTLDAINRVNELISQILGVPLSPCVAGDLGVLPFPEDEADGGCWDTSSTGTITFDGDNRSIILDATDILAPVFGNATENHPSGLTTGNYAGSPCTSWATVGDEVTVTGTIILLETNASGATVVARLFLRKIDAGPGSDPVPVIDSIAYPANVLIAAGTDGLDFVLTGTVEEASDPANAVNGVLFSPELNRGSAIQLCNLRATVNCGDGGFAEYPMDPTDTNFWVLQEGYDGTASVSGGPADFTISATLASPGDSGQGAQVTTGPGSASAFNKPKVCPPGAVVSFNYAYTNNATQPVTFFLSITGPGGTDQWAVELVAPGGVGSGSATINVDTASKGQITTAAGFAHTNPPSATGSISLQITNLTIA